MRISSVEVAGVTTYAHQVGLDLPDRGVVLVTGPNGSGKTTMLDAVAMALWGKSLRGTDLWSADRGMVACVVGGMRVERVRKGGRVGPPVWDGLEGEHDTKTKAQKALDSIVGPMRVWRRTCVISSSDTDAFTAAGDAERKRLLELLLGVDRFDDAHKQVRKDLRSSRHELDLQRTKEDSLRQRLADAEEALEAVPSGEVAVRSDTVRQRLVDLEERLSAAEERERMVRQAHADVARKAHEIEGERRAAQRQSDRIAGLDATCPTCEQTVDPDHRADACARAWGAVERLEATADDLDGQLRRAKSELADASDAVRELSRQVRDVDWELRDAEAAEERSRQAADLWRSLTSKVAKVRADLEIAIQKTEELEILVSELEVVEGVLGTKGVRATLLSRALVDLEACANAWLTVLGRADRPIGVEFSLSRAKKGSKGTVEEITMHVTGVSGGHGYAGASGGEQRRIDLAITAALSELAEHVAGWSGSTMWIDEAFDALDEDGYEAAVELVHRLSETRCVVVISHDPRSRSRLRPDMHVEVHIGPSGGAEHVVT